MALPLGLAIKNFLGLYVLTPFERQLLKKLSDVLQPPEREILADQLAKFTTVRRLIRHIDEPGAHGFTNFYTARFGKDISAKRQTRRFASNEPQALLATGRAIFSGGQIDIEFWLVGGVLFRMKYRSPQNIYYPPSDYSVEVFRVLSSKE